MNLPPLPERASPSLEALAERLSGAFERHYFANHGPMAQALDAALATQLGTRHAVCVVNWQLALMLAWKALPPHEGALRLGRALRDGVPQAMAWCGLQARASARDAFEDAHALSGVGGSVHRWLALGDAVCRPPSTDAQLWLLSMQAGEWIDAGEGGCIATDDDELAAILRTLRNFHPGHTHRSGLLYRTNAKISEAQAAQALCALDGLAARRHAQLQAQSELATLLPEHWRLEEGRPLAADRVLLVRRAANFDAPADAVRLLRQGVPAQARDERTLAVVCHGDLDASQLRRIAAALHALEEGTP